MSRIVEATQRVPASLAGARLDQAAAELFSDYSRERLKAWINAGELTVDGAKVKPKAKLHGHEVLTLNATIEEDTRFEPQDIALDIVYEAVSYTHLTLPTKRIV